MNNDYIKMHLQWFADEPKPVDKVEPKATDEPKPVGIDDFYKSNPEVVEKWIADSGIGKKVLGSWKDQMVTQGLNTWKENHLQSEIEKKVTEAKADWEKIGKLDPVKQAEAAAQLVIDKYKAEAERAKIKANASEMFNKLNLKFDKLSVDDFVRTSQDETNDVINRFYEEWREREKVVRDEEAKKFIKSNNYIPPSGGNEAVPFGGDRTLWAKAIREGKSPAYGVEFSRIENAIKNYEKQLKK